MERTPTGGAVSVFSSVPTREPGDIIPMGRHVFVCSEATWNRLSSQMPSLGFDLKSSETPRDTGALFVSANFEASRWVQCGHCGALVSASGSKAASGHWCSSCSKLLHLEVSAEPGNEAVFTVTRYADGRSDEARFALLDYEPATGEVTLAATPLGSKYARDPGEEAPTWPVRPLSSRGIRSFSAPSRRPPV
jgi:hypothetical protein